MRLLFRILFVLLSICIGTLFLYSAYTKVYLPESLENFEYTIVAYAHLPWLLSALASRFFIGLETALGGLIILHLYGKNKWVLKFAIGLLLVFSGYLVYLWISQGNNVNCGCFGDAIWMNPSTSLIKNGIMILVLLLLIKYHGQLRFRWGNLSALILLIAIIIGTYVTVPLPYGKPDWLKKSQYHIDLSSLYAPGKTDAPKIDLNKGKYIIAFFSPTCPHCQMAAFKMHLMKEKNPSLPFFMVIGGQMDLKHFWDKTHATNIPYTRLDKEKFFHLVGYTWPVIDWVNNGWVEAQSNYIDLNQSAIEQWIKK